MNTKCLLKKELKIGNLHKNIFNRGAYKLIPKDVNRIWRKVFLYDRGNYFKKTYITNSINIYKWKDILIQEFNFYKNSIDNINKIMNEFYKNNKFHSENSHKYYLNKISEKDINNIKNLHLFMQKSINNKILNLNKTEEKIKLKSILKENFKNKNKKNKNKIIILLIFIIFFFIIN
jgi:hypothetical protein